MKILKMASLVVFEMITTFVIAMGLLTCGFLTGGSTKVILFCGNYKQKQTNRHDEPTKFYICRYSLVKSFQQRIEAGLIRGDENHHKEAFK